MYVEQLSPESAMQLRPAQFDALAGLLQDVVAGGASVGFLAPLSARTARAYWRGVVAALGEELGLWLAYEGEHIVGAVQLAQCSKDNGRHRGEVQKLFVLRTHRGRGIARALIETVERHAVRRGLRLLVLDTEAGSPAERLYRRLGWQEAGMIPDYALSPDGRLHPTVYFYKSLTPHKPLAKDASHNSAAEHVHLVMI
ncbi:GNAT family N-acetyltransferase [Pseudomarimonas arenosa]|uniref:GNAT family N-acetyltransferase n=1 Tax=Pseudomarimonas arenosa TaxID=2774145 RepID=A0AAW3ZK92_9GAMM|nr:GNAT family N-acetyltransferase [Pseudomarimonas arenosa]MBD8525875.1 GNAT family N-acetyltransferase [Pseudomarimonas arenosa]